MFLYFSGILKLDIPFSSPVPDFLSLTNLTIKFKTINSLISYFPFDKVKVLSICELT